MPSYRALLSLRQLHKMPATVRTLLVVLLLVTLLAMALMAYLMREAHQRDRLTVYDYLNTVNHSHSLHLEEWLASRMNVLQTLARQDSFTLYLSEALPQPDVASPAAEATTPSPEITPTETRAPDTSYSSPELAYLRLQLQLAASKGGFETESSQMGLPHNPTPIQTHVSGIGLYDKHWNPLIFSRQVQPLPDAVKSQLRRLPLAEAHVLDHVMFRKQHVLLFAVPVYTVQGLPRAEDQNGWLLGIQPLEEELLKHLQPAAGALAGLTHQLMYRLPDKHMLVLGGSGRPALQEWPDLPSSTAAYRALQQPGRLKAGYSHTGERSFALTHQVAATGWFLVSQIPQSSMLAESSLRIQRMVLAGGLILTLLLSGIIWWWRHMTLQRADEVALLASHLAEHQAALDAISSHEPAQMFLTTASGTCLFANRQFATRLQVQADDIAGKSLLAVLGSHEAQRHLPQVQQVLDEQQPCQRIWEQYEQEKRVIYHTSYIPIAAFPTGEADHTTEGVLVVAQDITEVVQEKEKTERLSQQLVQTLMRLIDRRDPFTAGHSGRVAKLARHVAEEMELPVQQVKTVEIAGNLMNLGKIFVPEELLLQPGTLSAMELQQIRHSIVETADMLQDVEFEGDVAETIRQCKELWDGSGVLGLCGEAILLTARIISACNAFVSMVSPRAFREALTSEEAINTLLKEMESRYDRRVVLALANVVAKRGKHIME